jgi:hypothetical protein
VTERARRVLQPPAAVHRHPRVLAAARLLKRLAHTRIAGPLAQHHHCPAQRKACAHRALSKGGQIRIVEERAPELVLDEVQLRAEVLAL